MEVDIIITLAIAVGLIFTVGQIARTLRAQAIQRTLRQAIENGQALSPEIIDRLDRPPEPGSGDQRIGFVLVAIALAILCAGALEGSLTGLRELAMIALFPLFVGAALLLRLRLAARNKVEP